MDSWPWHFKNTWSGPRCAAIADLLCHRNHAGMLNMIGDSHLCGWWLAVLVCRWRGKALTCSPWIPGDSNAQTQTHTTCMIEMKKSSVKACNSRSFGRPASLFVGRSFFSFWYVQKKKNCARPFLIEMEVKILHCNYSGTWKHEAFQEVLICARLWAKYLCIQS
jgi:hypothetical protein